MSRRPVSVDTLLAQRRSAAASDSAPKFLSKAQRQALQQQKEREQQQQQEVHHSTARPPLTPGQHSSSSSQDNHSSRYRPPSSLSSSSSAASSGPRTREYALSASGSSLPPVTDAEQEAIRRRYLGLPPPGAKKPRKKTRERRWNFEHDLSEDTTDTSGVLPPPHMAAGPHGLSSLSSSATASASKPFEKPRSSLSDPLVRPSKKKNALVSDDRHWSEKPLSEMRERDWRIFREDFGIVARGGQIPKPLRHWHESSIPAVVQDAILDIGYTEPTPIQRQAIPIGLENRDLIGIAETGSGKTASFLIPLLSYLLDLPTLTEQTKSLGPYALILVPTRELAQQIQVEADKFGSRLGLRTVSIVGGKDMDDQAHALGAGCEIVIATPGRLQDTLEKHVLVLAQCSYLVMDEADRMLDMGFEPAVNYILDALPSSSRHADDEPAPRPRVTMLYSATMPAPLEKLARTYLTSPASITVGDANEASQTVEQRVEVLSSEDKKQARLLSLLREVPGPKIVFVNTILETERVAKWLASATRRAPAVLHSKRTQTQREEALSQLRGGLTDVLVSTNLAGRGIDVPDVALVVNYQMSHTIEEYIHRIGRTGRAGNRGLAITFVDLKADEALLYDLAQQLERSPLSRVPPEVARHPASRSKAVREPPGKRKRGPDGEGGW